MKDIENEFIKTIDTKLEQARESLANVFELLHEMSANIYTAQFLEYMLSEKIDKLKPPSNESGQKF